MEWCLPSVDSDVRIQLLVCMEGFVAYFADKGLYSAVHTQDMLGEGEFVGISLTTLVTFVGPNLTVTLVMPVDRPVIWKDLPTEHAGERWQVFVRGDMALQECSTGENASALPALVLEQAPTEDR